MTSKEKDEKVAMNTFSASRFGTRHLQMIAMTLTFMSLYIARGSMGVAILAMADTTQNNTSVNTFDWDKKTQSLILSSFFWGYVIMQIPAGILAKKFGGKPILMAALLINGVLSLLLPTLANLGGWGLVCACRVAYGLSQACLLPAMQTLQGQWFPPNERTSYSGIVNGGVQIGTIIAMPVSGLLAETTLGWKMIFYSMAGLLFFTAAVWYWCTGSTPAVHKWISQAERQYIEEGLNSTSKHSAMPTPWKKILTSVPVLALIPPHIGFMMSFVLFFVDMPTYLEKGLKISLKDSAFLSALPYIGMWIGNTASVIVAEKLINNNYIGIQMCRKVFNSIGMFGVTIAIICLSFMGPDNKVLAVVALISALFLSGFCSAGIMVNFLDLAPNFAGVLMSLANFVANIGSILMPIGTSYILQNDSSNIDRWRTVFLITSAITAGTNTIYLIFGSTDKQEWNDPAYFDIPMVDTEEMKSVLSNEELRKLEKEKEATS